MTFDYADRRRRLRAVMADSGVDSVILSVGPDLPYFTGYEAMASERWTAFIMTMGAAHLIVPELEAPRVDADGMEVIAWEEKTDPISIASGLLRDCRRVAVGDHMWSVFLTRLFDALSERRWTPASEITSRLRIRKDDEEIRRLRQAAHAVDRAMARVPEELRFAGRTEAAIAEDLSRMVVEEGHDNAEFAIVASGPNGSSPHHHPGARVVETGDLVVCDFGGRWEGYHSDSTRTFVVGQPTARQLEIHQIVEQANRVGRESVGPGVSGQDVDRRARKVIEDAGYGDRFIHRTGHGIGLEVHEHPYIVEGNSAALETGMTFSIEPGIYLTGALGVRIEDIVVCTDDGIESLNESSRSLVSVE